MISLRWALSYTSNYCLDELNIGGNHPLFFSLWLRLRVKLKSVCYFAVHNYLHSYYIDGTNRESFLWVQTNEPRVLVHWYSESSRCWESFLFAGSVEICFCVGSRCSWPCTQNGTFKRQVARSTGSPSLHDSHRGLFSLLSTGWRRHRPFLPLSLVIHCRGLRWAWYGGTLN